MQAFLYLKTFLEKVFNIFKKYKVLNKNLIASRTLRPLNFYLIIRWYMPKTKEQKRTILHELNDKVSRAKSIIFAKY
ncbi:MAG: hypothetical protein Q8O59_01065, partial [bacterium]|nr:hypothetical protein [bacterium]